MNRLKPPMKQDITTGPIPLENEQTSPGLSVFVPLYNEADILEKNVLALTDHLNRLDVSYEVILGSNGSTDNTPQVGSHLADAFERISFFQLALRGPGLAFAEALKRAEYNHFLCVDIDLSVELAFIERALAALTEYDAVVGSKQVNTQKRPVYRILASEIFIAFSKCLLKMPYRDYAIGAKAYRTDTIRIFLPRIDRHTFYTQELLYQLQRSGRRIIEIPVSCSDRRKSKFNLIHEGIYRHAKLFELWMRSKKDR
jgi:glycosyltransferase involved in cell wall biosynthesis